MNLSQQGKIVLQEIQQSIRIRENWVFHAWVIMPNHIHLLIEIKNEFPKWNFSTIEILDDTVDIESRKLFLNSSETNCSATLPQDNSENIHFKEYVETHCSASLLINLKRTPKSISSFVAQFKSKTTKTINDYDKYSVGSVWQNNYYDRIIWSEEDFKSAYYYIKNNPKNWDTDDLNKL